MMASSGPSVSEVSRNFVPSARAPRAASSRNTRPSSSVHVEKSQQNITEMSPHPSVNSSLPLKENSGGGKVSSQPAHPEDSSSSSPPLTKRQYDALKADIDSVFSVVQNINVQLQQIVAFQERHFALISATTTPIPAIQMTKDLTALYSSTSMQTEKSSPKKSSDPAPPPPAPPSLIVKSEQAADDIDDGDLATKPSKPLEQESSCNQLTCESDFLSETNPSLDNRVDVGLQTEELDDPDIYYFAGGRNIACQTDSFQEQYPPLIPMPSGATPVIIVLDPSDSDTEIYPTLMDSTTITLPSEAPPSNTCESNQLDNNYPVTDPPSCSSTTAAKTLTESSSCGVDTCDITSNPTNIMETAVSTVVETKSSATQLSVGVLVEEVAENKSVAAAVATDGSGDYNPKLHQQQVKVKDTAAEVTPPVSVSSAPSANANTKTTFADKAKNGMLRQSSLQAKSVPANMNKIGTLPSSQTRTNMSMSANSSSNPNHHHQNHPQQQNIQKGKIPQIPSYRSNIASRCRTAVNTNKQQVLSPVKSKYSLSSLSSSVSSSAGLNSSILNKSPTLNSFASNTKRTTSFTTNNVSSTKTLGNGPSHSAAAGLPPQKSSESTEKQKHASGSNASRQGGGGGGGSSTVSNRSNDNRNGNDSRSGGGGGAGGGSGMVRSKSMINPPSNSTPYRRSHNNSNSAVNVNRNAENKKQMGRSSNNILHQHQGNNRKSSSGSSPGTGTKNFVSLPDVSYQRKRNSTVDEDGWETVRARSNRTKWSPSGSSLSIPLIAENTMNGACGVVNGTTSSSNSSNNNVSTAGNGNTNGGGGGGGVWNDDDNAADADEEIKKKEEDLDNAIREEELLEEELRQVEKDLEMIENESRDDTTTSEKDNAPSPDSMQPIQDMDTETEKEQFFFICMDNENSAKSEDFPPRESGRIVALREKLMSPAKRCDGAETLRKYQAKLAKAERNREKLLQAKYNRYVELSERFEALNETTKKLVSERAELIAKAEARLQRAAENRKQYLQNIVKKAHDEDAKAKEIAFINLLEAQNKRHDYLATAHEIEGRLQTIQEERRLKLEERASKAMCVIQRQSRIRSNWQSKLERMQEKRRKADERITREKEEKAKERSELAQEKARDREERISALNAAKQAEKEELQKKIQQKQEDTARRHEENMEQIRQKAIELSVPRTQEDNAVPAVVRVCTLCKVSLPSEVQELAHLRGRGHIDAVKKAENIPAFSSSWESYGLKYVCDLQMDKIDFKIQVDKNRFKILKKHCKKLMQKMVDSGLDYEKGEMEKANMFISTADPDLKAKVHKNIKEVDRLVSLFEKEKGSAAMATSMDRLMSEIRRNSVKVRSIKDVVISLGAVPTLLRVVRCSAKDLPDKVKISACSALLGILFDSQPNVIYCLRGTAICHIVEFCAERLSSLIPEGSRWRAGTATSITEKLPYDPVIESLLELIFQIINTVPDPFHGIGREGVLEVAVLDSIKSRVLDLIGYLVASSVIDRFSIYCSAVRGPIEDQSSVAELLKMILDFLVMNVYALHFCWTHNGGNGKKETDTTQLLAALETSELAGTVSMSYNLLLHQGAPTRPRLTPGNPNESELQQPVPPPPGSRTCSIVRSTLLLINATARLDHQTLQNVLGSEAVSLQFRHIASQLLWQVVPHRSNGGVAKLLSELLIAIAYFTIGNKHNQVTIQSGQTPTVLQQLCTVPEEFFRDMKYIKTLFPTLISATYGCPENVEILQQNNIDLQALDCFMQSHHAAKNDILKHLKLTPSSKMTDEIYPHSNVKPSSAEEKENQINTMNGSNQEVNIINNLNLMNGHAKEIVS